MDERNEMSAYNGKELKNGSRGKPLEERISEFSTTAQKTFRDLVTLSRDLLYTEEGDALIRQKIEDAGREFEARVHQEIRSRTSEKESSGEESGNFEKKKIRID